MATRVTGTKFKTYYTPWFSYDITVNNATTYTFKLNLGVTSTKTTAAQCGSGSRINKRIGSGSWDGTQVGSMKNLPAKSDTIILSNDVWSVTKTHTTQTVTIDGIVSVPLDPGEDHGHATKTFTVPAKTSYPVTYNVNSGSGAPAQQTKWYNETLALSSVKPTKAGYTFKGWATSEANAKIGTVDYASGATVEANTNSALSLWAVWELNYSKPIISNFDVKRCLNDGTIDDEGTYAKAVFDWSIFTSQSSRYYGGTDAPYSNNTVSSCVVTVGDKSINVTLTGTSGHAEPSDIIGNGSNDPFNTNNPYNASITITDSQTTQSAHTITVTDTLSSSHFPLDFNANATAMGVFCPAPDREGVFIGSDLVVRGMAGMIQMTAIPAGGPGSNTLVPADNTTIYEPISGWLICNGASISALEYPELFNAIKYAYGGSGNNFNLPDLRGRFPIGGGTGTAADATAHSLNQKNGREKVTLSAVNMPYHRHSIPALSMSTYGGFKPSFIAASVSTGSHTTEDNPILYANAGRTTSNRNNAYNGASNTGGSHSHTTNANNTGYAGGSNEAATAHENMPPYIGVNFIIATGKIL